MTRPRVHKFSRREIASCVCNDCGKNVIKAGNYVMIDSDIWEKKLKLGWNDNLCLEHVEQRLGRKVSFARGDFIAPPPEIEGYPPSDALMERFGFDMSKKTAKKKTVGTKAERVMRPTSAATDAGRSAAGDA